MIEAIYTTADRVSCQSCNKSTRGILTLLLPVPEKFRICPRCRDTHSIFRAVTGHDLKTVSITSPDHAISSVPADITIPPMLARALDAVAPKYLVPTILGGSTWIACEKLDGVRAMCYFMEDGAHFLSRNISSQTGVYADKTANVPHLSHYPMFLKGTVLDGELLFHGGTLNTGSVITDSMLSATSAIINSGPEKSLALQQQYGELEYTIFDVPIFNGMDIRDKPLSYRYHVLDQIVSHIITQNQYYNRENYVQGTKADKEAFYERIIQDGGEGVMYKDLNSSYCKNPTSRPVSWVKRKVRRTVEAFISDFTPGEAGYKGMVGALVLSVFQEDGTPVEVARVSNLTLQTREEVTSAEGALKQEYYDQVVEVSFQEVTGRSGRGRHAVLERWRPEKNKEDCTMKSLRMS